MAKYIIRKVRNKRAAKKAAGYEDNDVFIDDNKDKGGRAEHPSNRDKGGRAEHQSSRDKDIPTIKISKEESLDKDEKGNRKKGGAKT